MSRLSRVARRLRARDEHAADGGFAMLTAIGTVLVLSLLVAAATTSALSSVPSARASQDFQTALGAAEAGVDDYLSHLTLDATYYTKGNTDAANPALGSASYTSLPGSTTGAGFHYTVLSTVDQVTATGMLVLSSTGHSAKVTRTVRATLAKKSFLDYLYFTRYETLDPLNTPDPAGFADCATYAWASPARPSGCSKVAWTTADDLNGPVYSQDSLLVNGNPTFRSGVETGWDDPAQVYWSAYTGTGAVSSAPVFQAPPNAPTRSWQEMPGTNANLRAQAIGGNGCLYTGPTTIVFNSAGTMTVTSPFTTTSTFACGTFTGPSYTATVAVPANGVVYVDPATADCTTAGSISKFAAVGYPLPLTGQHAEDTSQDGVSPLLGYACTNGDAFVEGTVKGRVTLATANNIILTQNLQYAGGTTGTDVIGLAAANFVQVYRPLTCGTGAADRESGTNRCLAGTDVTVTGRYPWVNPVVQAAVVATSHAFFVQNWRLSGTGTSTTAARAMGTLNFTGALAQRFRGPVSYTNTDNTDPLNRCHGTCGYAKGYTYDARLKFAAPPYLADLTTTAWGMQAFAEGPS